MKKSRAAAANVGLTWVLQTEGGADLIGVHLLRAATDIVHVSYQAPIISAAPACVAGENLESVLAGTGAPHAKGLVSWLEYTP